MEGSAHSWCGWTGWIGPVIAGGPAPVTHYNAGPRQSVFEVLEQTLVNHTFRGSLDRMVSYDARDKRLSQSPRSDAERSTS